MLNLSNIANPLENFTKDGGTTHFSGEPDELKWRNFIIFIANCFVHPESSPLCAMRSTVCRSLLSKWAHIPESDV